MGVPLSAVGDECDSKRINFQFPHINAACYTHMLVHMFVCLPYLFVYNIIAWFLLVLQYLFISQVLILQLVYQFVVSKWCNEIKVETLIKFAICVVFYGFWS